MGNQLTIVTGRITEPKSGTTQNGKKSLSFSIPVSITSGRQDNLQRETFFYSVQLYEQAADRVAPQIHKGAVVMVSGVVKPSTYTKRDGTTGLNLQFQMGAKVNVVQSDNMQPEGQGQGGYQSNQPQGGQGYRQNNQPAPQGQGYQGNDGFMDGGYGDPQGNDDYGYQQPAQPQQPRQGQAQGGYNNRPQGNQQGGQQQPPQQNNQQPQRGFNRGGQQGNR